MAPLEWTGFFYSIASRAAQSNLVYVSVLKIPIVHADKIFFSFISAIFHQNKHFWETTLKVKPLNTNVIKQN